MISRDEGLTFTSVWGDSYVLNFGNFNDTGTGDDTMKYIVYLAANFINILLMLNLLISILGYSYSRFLVEEVVVNIHKKLEFQLSFRQ